MLERKMHVNSISRALTLLMILGCLGAESCLAALVTPKPEDEKAVYDAVFMQRKALERDGAALQRAYEAKQEAFRAELLASRNGPLPPEEQSFGIDESDRNLSRSYETADLVLAGSIALLVLALGLVIVHSRRTYARVRAEKMARVSAGASKKASELQAITAALDKRVADKS